METQSTPDQPLSLDTIREKRLAELAPQDIIRIYGHGEEHVKAVSSKINTKFDAYPYNDEYALACSDGTLISVYYNDEGKWQFDLLYRGKAFLADMNPLEDEDNEKHTDYPDIPPYSGYVLLDATVIEWVVFGMRS
jgi:hypothetical protein